MRNHCGTLPPFSPVFQRGNIRFDCPQQLSTQVFDLQRIAPMPALKACFLTCSDTYIVHSTRGTSGANAEISLTAPDRS